MGGYIHRRRHGYPRAFSADLPTQLRCFGGPSSDPPTPWRRAGVDTGSAQKMRPTRKSRACSDPIGLEHALVAAFAESRYIVLTLMKEYRHNLDAMPKSRTTDRQPGIGFAPPSMQWGPIRFQE